MSEKQGYDKSKKHPVTVDLTAEQMDIFFENKQRRGIKTNAEYLRRLIRSDSEGDGNSLIDLEQTKDQLADAEKKLKGAEKEIKFKSQQAKENANLANDRLGMLESAEAEVSHLHNKVSELSKGKGDWMNAFVCLELAIINADIEELKNISHPALEDENLPRINNIRDIIAESNPVLVKELKSQIENKEKQIVDTWVIIGNLEDAINRLDIDHIHALKITEEGGELGISQERKEVLTNSIKMAIEYRDKVCKPSFGFTLKQLWRSIFK